MEAWNGWPVERLVHLFIAAAYLLVWLQVWLLHWRGAFRNRFMWGPVVFTPFAVLAALAYGFSRSDATGTLYDVVFAAAALVGLIGTVFHFRGIASQVGGLNLRNAATGPPPLLPIIYMALGAFGVLLRHWPGGAG